MWLQRPRITWPKEGDMNTKYFHSKVVWRARKNKIRELTNSIGLVHLDLLVMKKGQTSIFQGIFSADNNLDARPVLDLLDSMVTEEGNTRFV